MEKQKTLAVSLRCDDAYRAALKEVARRRKMKVGDLVRAILDEHLGSELVDLTSFFTSNGNSDYRSGASATKGKAS